MLVAHYVSSFPTAIINNFVRVGKKVGNFFSFLTRAVMNG